jgi:hypothetical protein
MCADFVSVAPDDVRDLNSIRDSRPFRRMYEFPHVAGPEALQDAVSELRRGTGAYTQQSLWKSVVDNPVAATVHFHQRITLMNRVLLGIDTSLKKARPFALLPKAALGRLRACDSFARAWCVCMLT